jgi:tetratricopeptide (TPR) repeat protein
MKSEVKRFILLPSHNVEIKLMYTLISGYRLCKANNAIECNQHVKALEILTDVLASVDVGEAVNGDVANAGEAANGDVANAGEAAKLEQHEVLVQRAGVHMEMKSYEKAREDAQAAILLKPDYIKGYLRLSSAELELKQFGRAEVVLKLGLKISPGHSVMKAKLKSLEDQDSVLGSVRALNSSDMPVRAKQNKAGMDLGMYNFSKEPPVIRFIMHGDLLNLKKVWRPDMVGYKHGAIKNPLMHYPVLGIQRIDPNDPSVAARRHEDYIDVIDFLFDQV